MYTILVAGSYYFFVLARLHYSTTASVNENDVRDV